MADECNYLSKTDQLLKELLIPLVRIVKNKSFETTLNPYFL